MGTDDWKSIRYPHRRAPLLKTADRKSDQHLPGLYGPDSMIPPLELLDEIVKELVYIKD